MKIDRLLGIVMLLLQQDKATAPELAQRFEVSQRTIHRDVEDICKAGIPLITIQGRGGGISIAEPYKVNKTFFTETELQAILSGLGGLDSVSQQPDRNAILDRLSTRGQRVVAEDVIVIDLADHYFDTLSEKISAIKQAILDRRTIRFRYVYEKGEQPRHIEPYRLLFQWSSWYVLGYCLDRTDFRLFKLNRLWDLQTQETTFTPRPIPAEALDRNAYFTSGPRHRLKARFAPQAKYRLIEEYGVDCFTPCPDGSLLFTWDFVSYENLRAWVFSFGDQVEILAPEALRLDRLQQAKTILSRAKKDES